MALNGWFCVSMVLTLLRLGEWFSPALLVRLAPMAAMVGLNLAALGLRTRVRVPGWLWPAAALPTLAWAAFFGWPLHFAARLFGAQPAG